MSADRYTWLHTVPALALSNALKKAGLATGDLDLVEINEAFAAVALNATRMLELCAIAEPEVGVVLNIGLTHVSKVGSPEAIVAEKLSLARYLAPSGTAVLNSDDPRISPVIRELSCRVISFGACESATLRRGPIESLGLDGATFPVSFEGQTVTVVSPLPGTHLASAAR